MPLLFFILCASSEPVRVDNLVVSGLAWTHVSVVETEIGYRAGDTIDAERFALGITRLWNCGIFSEVDGFLETDDGGITTAYYTLKERFFLAPVINFTILTNSSFWIQGGVKSINTGGRFIDVEAAYERFNTQNGGYLAIKQPRLGGERLELGARFERLSRPRPEFVHVQTRGFVQLGALTLKDYLWLQGGMEAGLSEFTPPVVAPLNGDPVLPRSTWKGAVFGSLRGGRIDTIRLRQIGVSGELRPVLGLAFSEDHPLYFQIVAELLAFFAPGARWNIALRANAGASSLVPTQLRFYVGGLDQVRGFVDNYLRTDLYLVCNAEVRVILFDGLWDWLAIMAVAFVDGVMAHAEPGGVTGAASLGLGVRLLIPKFPRSGLRVDVAQPLMLNAIPQVSFGAFQFF